MAVDKLVDSAQLNADLSSVADAIRTKGGTSAQLAFPSGFVSAVEAIETGRGGSGATVISSGSFVGAGTNGRQYNIQLGTKMPQTDFYILVKAEDSSVYERNTSSYFTWLAAAVFSDLGYYDLSADGNARPFVSTFIVKDNNADVITDKAAGEVAADSRYIRSGGVSPHRFNTFTLNRTATGFTMNIGQSNTAYVFSPSVTFDFKVIYFGSNPDSDMVEIA